MIRVEPAIIVEGRYDKNKLKQIFDAMVLDIGGFGILSGDWPGSEAFLFSPTGITPVFCSGDI